MTELLKVRPPFGASLDGGETLANESEEIKTGLGVLERTDSGDTLPDTLTEPSSLIGGVRFRGISVIEVFDLVIIFATQFVDRRSDERR